MSQNILQIFTANPASSMVATDLLYLGRSPYGPTDDFAITFANFVASIGTATPTASTIPRWDAHVNMSANNFLAGFASTATAAGTTTLTVSSAYNQYFTGSTTQTVVLPVTSTLALGFPFRIINNSTGVVTVQSSGANTIQAMAPGSTLLLTCILTSGTTAASWDAQYIIATDVSGAVLLSPSGDQTIVAHNLILATGSYQATLGTYISGSSAGGIAGEFIAYSNTAANGSLAVLCANNGGNYANILTNASTTSARTWSLPDASGTVGLNSGSTTYAPTITFATPGDLSVSYATQIGSYCQVGNVITVNFIVQFTPTYTTASGAFRLSMPIVASSFSTYFATGSIAISTTNLFPVGATYIASSISNGLQYIVLFGNGSGINNSLFGTTQFVSGVVVQLIGEITYQV